MSQTLWNDEQIARVKELFGDTSPVYGWALVQRPELVQHVRQVVSTGEEDYTPHNLIEHLAGADGSLDVERATCFLGQLQKQDAMEELLASLERSPGYLQHVAFEESRSRVERERESERRLSAAYSRP